jgi:hypothetical protein
MGAGVIACADVVIIKATPAATINLTSILLPSLLAADKKLCRMLSQPRLRYLDRRCPERRRNGRL